ncbi:hypothetical protein P153DRAFT_393194 [Dothidotthia symphoricarpi CBS 119687]|uniref:Uncharacterized protein n=1 Tax=Dothidotthia symphoricarpi CBS 119687 TaxID=1392245 RepID=A0A6A6ANK8_9PLEO|nr:uncharacterized protein P153DRAFT_393194 [Dothidotthia symphoricarpi CBS 119687]KAF2133370.1 hypothetical protein P153DRAFT_393194 [Dothidotthia symphoricarpi CBS 119687]
MTKKDGPTGRLHPISDACHGSRHAYGRPLKPSGSTSRSHPGYFGGVGQTRAGGEGEDEQGRDVVAQLSAKWTHFEGKSKQSCPSHALYTKTGG